MADLQKIGPDWGGAGTFKPFTAGISGGQRTNDAHGRFLDASLGGRVFTLSAAAAAPTAYTGGAAGTPLLALHNPANSNKVLSVLLVSMVERVAASAAGVASLNLFAGPSVIPTGTATVPTNTLSLAAAGSAAKGFVNTALTASTALSLLLPLVDWTVGTAAVQGQSPGVIDLGGIILVAPGNQIAVGIATIPTALTVDVALFWEELSNLAAT